MLGIPLNYERVERQLASADIELGAGEVHGVLCGLICSGHTDARACWYGEVFADHSEGGLLEQECRASLDQLCSETEEAIGGPGLGFTPFLPDDDAPLLQRTTAVSEWCQGFLYGVGLGGAASDLPLSDEAGEALKDFAEISQMDTQSLEESEEEEDALTEIVEFIWVAAMLVYGERVSDPVESS
ncbi:MAG: UPF0149 family protein [Sedimenticola sp.]